MCVYIHIYIYQEFPQHDFISIDLSSDKSLSFLCDALTSLANLVNPENDTSDERWNRVAKFYRKFIVEKFCHDLSYFSTRGHLLRSTLVFLFPRSFDSARANLGLRKWQRALLPKSLGFLLKMAVHWPEKHHLVSKTSVVLRRRVEHTRVPFTLDQAWSHDLALEFPRIIIRPIWR